MPLPAMKTARRCHAHTKSTGQQCHNPAAFGMLVCRLHGARKKSTILKGRDHPNYRHGQDTQEAKATGIAELKFLRRLVIELKKTY